MPEKDDDKIVPVNFDLNDSPLFSNHSVAVDKNKPPAWIWIGLALLIVAALVVIFVLPAIVTEYELPLERRINSTLAPTAVAPVNPVITVSPFEEAQRSLERKEAQDVLAVLLEKQGELDTLEVERWGQADYQAALGEASFGDEYYRTQDFALATEFYTRGRDGLIELLDTVPIVMAQTMVDAKKALDEADSLSAQEKYSLVLLFDSQNEQAQIGLGRALVLDQVTVLFNEAEALYEDGELEAARDFYQQILALDGYNEKANGRSNEVAAQITENEFSTIMSRGYAFLESGNPGQAINTFEQAANLGVRQEQALAAIIQTETEVANAQINDISLLISAAESQEKWQTAVDEYDKVLAIDSNLLFAIDGRDYADKRAQLDRLLVDANENPERFAEDAVFQQTLNVYYTGRAVEDPGPRLVGQLDELQVLLENSQVPLDIQLVSDNLTDVTLLRIGNIGSFEQHSVSLKPGRYVAVGRRAGFREVREEFTVGFGLTPVSVVVQCEERIASSNRR